jgi:hypothetical protein
LLRFIHALLRASWHYARERYYDLAHRHAVEHGHPDAPMLCRRFLYSRGVVNDFLRGRFL